MRREPDIGRFLAHLPLFEGLDEAQIARLAAGALRRRLCRGDWLFRQGEPPSALYAVVHGRIALVARSPSGNERVTDVVGAGRSFGEAVLLLEQPTVVGARALGDALVIQLARDTVIGELERNPRFARRIIATLAAKLHAAVRELDSYALGSGGQRFAAWLLRSTPPGAAGAATIALPAAKRAIASRLNLSAEHLSRILRELTARNLIEVQGRQVHVPDVRRLRAWSVRRRSTAQA